MKYPLVISAGSRSLRQNPGNRFPSNTRLSPADSLQNATVGITLEQPHCQSVAVLDLRNPNGADAQILFLGYFPNNFLWRKTLVGASLLASYSFHSKK